MLLRGLALVVAVLVLLSGCITQPPEEEQETSIPDPPAEPVVLYGQAQSAGAVPGPLVAPVVQGFGTPLEFDLPSTTFQLNMTMSWQRQVHAFTMVVTLPDGSVQEVVPAPQQRRIDVEIADPQIGLYRIEARGQGVYIQDNITIKAAFGYILTADFQPVVTVTEENGAFVARAHVEVRGHPLEDATLIAETTNGEIRITGIQDNNTTVALAPWAKAATADRAREILNSLELRLYVTSTGIVGIIESGDAALADGEGLGGDVVMEVSVRVTGEADTTNGGIEATALQVNGFTMDTTNGGISGDVASWGALSADTTNGEIAFEVDPKGSQRISMDSTNGGVALVLRESSGVGYKLAVDTTNGGITESMSDASLAGEDDHAKTLQTSGFSSRGIKVTGSVETTNGDVSFAGA